MSVPRVDELAEGRSVAAPAAARRATRVTVLVLAVLVPAWLYLAGGREQLNLADEGYLWYGVLRTVAGEWPLRDFQAYDPGRYHWCALFSPLVGDGLLGVRAATLLFVVPGLAAGLAVLAAGRVRSFGLTLAGIVLGLWLFPRHKLFEPAVALMLAWAIARMLASPTPRRHFAAGLLAGLSLDIGRNHAFYGALAGVAALALDRWKDPRPGFARRAAAWAGGVVTGVAPFALQLLLVPGLGRGFAYSVRLNLVQGTNLPRPWPWPWTVEFGPLPVENVRAAIEAAAFTLPIVAVPVLAWIVARTPPARWRERAPLVATALFGTIYLHHAAVRSDMWHLAQAIAPLLVAVLLAPACLGARRAVTACVWGALALLSAAVGFAFNTPLTARAQALVPHEIGGERLMLSRGKAAKLTAIEETVAQYVGAAPLFVAPNRPMYYCMLGKRAPTWWIYYFWKLPPDEQDATIARLAEQGCDWALIVADREEEEDYPSFQETNDRLWAHFEREWMPVTGARLPKDHFLLRRR